MASLYRFNLADVALEEKVHVADQDERWGQGRATVILQDQVVALGFPVDVTVALHFGEGVTG